LDEELPKGIKHSMQIKLFLYWSAIRAIVVMAVKHGSFNTVLYKKSLCVERKILRKICEPTEEANGI
jgi:hypothetical protein